MGEETSNTMNLDLNLGPGQGQENNNVIDEMENVNPMTDETHRFRHLVWGRTRRLRWRRVQVPTPLGHGSISTELNQTMDSSANLSLLQVGEGSVTAEDGGNEAPKACEINNSSVEDETTERKEDSMKTDREDGSFFDCNICLDLANNPVVTCCGHLFCWSCLYRWLHYHSGAKQCPVCKGKVTIKNLTPIYGRGNNNRTSEEDGDSKIPVRPQARKVESLMEVIQRTGITCSLEDLARYLGNRSDLTQDLVHQHENENSSETFGRALNTIMTSRGRRTQLQVAILRENEVDLTHGGDIFGTETEENTHLRHQSLSSGQSHQANIPPPSNGFSPARSPFLDHFIDRSPGHPMPVENVDPFLTIIAVTNSEDQIDLRGPLSSSSARERNDVSRVLEVDNRDSHPPRRRRLNGQIDLRGSRSSSSARGRNDVSRVLDVNNRHSRPPRRRRLDG